MSNKLISTVDDHDHGHDHAHEAKSCCSSAKRGVKAVDDHNHGHDHSHGGGGCCSSVKHVPLEDTCTSGCCSTEPVKPVDDHDHGHDHAHSGGCCSSTGKTVPPEDSCTSGCCSSEPSKAVDDHRYHNKGSCCSSDAKAERVVPSEDTCTSGCCALEPAKPASCCASEPAKPASCCSAEKTCGDGCSAECCSSSAKETKKCSSTCCSPEEEGECKKGCCEAKTPAKALVVVAASPAPSLLVVNTAPAAPTPAPLPIVKPDTKLDTKPADTIAVVVERPTVCSACDPSSPVPHTLQVTRLRVANMCCAGEEKILRQALEGATGVEQIAVNVIGRYAVIKHCATPCCTPVATLVDLLNAKHLGVSVSEVAGSDASDEEERLDRKHLSLVSLVWLLFVVGCAVSHSHPLSSDILFLVSIGLGLIPVLSAAGVALFMRRTIDISVLMTLAIAGAVAAEEYFDGSLVVALFLSAELLEAYIMLRVRAAIRASSTQMAKDAYLASGAKVAVADLKIDDVIAVRAGEMILGDGVVVKGEGVVDESALTGESVPVGKKVGAVVLSGTVVQNGYLEVRLTSNTAENTVNRLKQTIEDVQADKGTYARLVDRFAVYWTPGVLLAVLCLIVIGGAVSEDWYVFVNRGLILLVLACPCAILIAAPVPSVCAIAAAAKQGVLLKGSSVLERMASIDTIAVDKTGTLTKGFFKVTERCRLGGDDLDFDPMQLAAAIEAKSTHPLANAVVTEFTGCVADMDMVALPPVRKIQVVDGVGVTGWVEVDSDWKFVAVGNEKLLKENGGKVRTTPAQREALTAFLSRSQGKVTLLVCVEDELCLLLSLADEVRPESSTFVGEVRGRLGMTVSMITGDHRDVALKVCEAVGIPAEECHARLLPADKLSWVQTAQQETGAGKHVLMVGDGINDSTGLAAASVGVAMGAGGSAMAVYSADVVLLTDNLLLLPPTIRLCRQTDRTMKEGFVFAIAVKVMAIVLAILGLLTFWQAVLIDIGTLLIVVVNGTKALWWFTSFEVRVTTAKGVGNGGKGDVYELAPSAVGLEMV